MSKRYAVVPHPKLKREYKGRLVRTTRVLKNGWGLIPLGAVATVTHQSPKGSELTFEPCDCCGLKAIISHVSMDSIEFIEPITEEEDGREQAQHWNGRWAQRAGSQLFVQNGKPEWRGKADSIVLPSGHRQTNNHPALWGAAFSRAPGSCRESRTIPPAGGVWADLR
nr:hypothetical protein LOCMHKOF_00057 [Providencia stuartii]